MGYKKFNKKDNSSMITFVGITVETAEDLLQINKDKDMLETLMRLQSCAMRTSYVDITKRGFSRKESTNKTTERFLNNLRYMRDAYTLAEQTVSSQKALLPTYLEDYQKKIKKSETKLTRLEKSKKIKNKEERLQKIRKKIKKYRETIEFYQNHIDNDTCPPAVFGGKASAELLKFGKITKDEWVNSRRNCLYSVGEKSKGGNENMKLTHLHDNMFQLSILNPLAEKKGTRLKFVVKFPEKMVSKIIEHIESGEAYTVRIMKDEHEYNKYSVHITMSSLTSLDEELLKLGVAGIDINPDNISVAIVDSIGNFKYSKIFKFPEINYVNSNRRNHIIGNVVKSVVNYIKSMGVKVVIIEDLKFSNNYTDNSNLNKTRYAVPFQFAVGDLGGVSSAM